MKKLLFLLPIITLFTSCTTEENYIVEETMIDGAYFNEIRMENQNIEIQPGTKTAVGEIVFDAQNIPLQEIETDLELNRSNYTINQFVKSITLEKIVDNEIVENDLFLSSNYNDFDDDISMEWNPLPGKELLSLNQRYRIIVESQEIIPAEQIIEFNLSLYVIDLFGDRERFSHSDINGNFYSLIFKN